MCTPHVPHIAYVPPHLPGPLKYANALSVLGSLPPLPSGTMIATRGPNPTTMRTLITSLAIAASAAAFAQQNTTPPAPQDPAAFQMSIYDECLRTAGKNSWEVLHLDQQQVASITALQTRYKEEAAAAKEMAMKEGKKPARQTKAEAKYDVPPTPADQPYGNDTTGTMDDELDATAAVPMDDAGAPLLSPVDQELHTILTPEQLAIWERRCDMRMGMKP